MKSQPKNHNVFNPHRVESEASDGYAKLHRDPLWGVFLKGCGMSITEKKSFQLYHDMSAIVNVMTDEQAGKLLKAILEYVNGQEPEINDPVALVAFQPVRQSLDRDHQAYINISNRNRENGKKGGRPKKTQKNPENPVGYLGNPEEPKKADTDTDTDTDKDIDTKSITPQTPQGASVRTKASLEYDFTSTFWPSIKRKIGKGQALKAYISAFKKNNCQLTPEELAERYNQHVDDQKEIQYSKHPATWLNAIGWEDEEATPRGYESPPAELEKVSLAEPEGWLEHVRVSYSQHVYKRMTEQYEGKWENLKQSEQEAITENMAEEVA